MHYQSFTLLLLLLVLAVRCNGNKAEIEKTNNVKVSSGNDNATFFFCPTPLHEAARNGDLETVRRLAEKRYQYNRSGWSNALAIRS